MAEILQICPNDHPPFADLLVRFEQAAVAAEINIETVVLSPSIGQPVAGMTYLNVEDLGNTRALRKAFAENVDLQAERDLILCHRYRAYTLGLMCKHPRRKIVTLAHEFGLLDSWSRRLQRRLFAKQVCFAGVSPAVSEELARNTGMGAVIPNVIDPHEFAKTRLDRGTARQQLGLTGPGPWIAVIGRLHYKKRPELALQAFQQFKADHADAEIAFLGEGSASTTATLANGGAKLLGNVPDAHRYLAAFDVVLHTGNVEAFGMVLLEAMAAGVPAVALSGGGPEYVLGDVGFYPEEDSARGFANALGQAVSADTEDIAERGRQRIERMFTVQVLSDTLTNLVAFVAEDEKDPFAK